MGRRQSVTERFWRFVDKTPGHGPDGDCWLWIGGTTSDGYGVIKVGYTTKGKRRSLKAHRLACELSNKFIAEDKVARHTCDIRLCVNPEHMIEGTHADNVADRVARGRSAVGTKNGRAKLSEDDVLTIRELVKSEDIATIARNFQVDRALIRRIRDGKIWKSLILASTANTT